MREAKPTRVSPNSPAGKPAPSPAGPRAFTLIELLVILIVLGVSFAVLLHLLAREQQHAKRISCVSNLKMIGISYKLWADDRTNGYPMQVPASKGGTRELIGTGLAYVHFQVLSNELVGVPRVLVCPADRRKPAKDFASLSNTNISYFVGLDAQESTSGMLLAGDRNLTNGVPLPSTRILVLPTNSVVGWTRELHNCQGNISLADGSVQQVSSARLSAQVAQSGATNRLAMP